MAKQKELTFEKVPRHIAIIMDGNGRWAKARMLPRMAGHRAGAENLRRIITACVDFGVRYLTIFAFSTENWKRPADEVNGLMEIFADLLEKEVPKLHAQGVQIRHLGSIQELNPTLQRKLQNAIQTTQKNERLILSIALNYGGRDEIIHAVKEIVKKGTPADAIDEQTIKDHLYTRGMPDPDLVIRTSGELRTSNFLLWQTAYSEWLFTETYWPDFNKDHLQKAILEYGTRSRRFGGRTKKEEEETYNG
ncbi:MAG TPA: isoprenyl transferase [Anaerolineaceae bacterium]|jgi:undecaprenyl diphosphate synthase|nr:isoprenyl transferase [Anaerolineaceae bacterium]